MNVYKFGGASVKNVEGIKNMAEILLEVNEPLFVVISAMGKTTNKLEAILFEIKSLDQQLATWNKLIDEHLTVMKELECLEFGVVDIEKYRAQGIDILNSKNSYQREKLYDQIVSFGELLSTTIFASYLASLDVSACWVDARKLIKTDSHFRNANVKWRETEHAVKEIVSQKSTYSYIVTQGFLGGTSDGFTTTLGREGSDYTAAILSYCLDSDSMTVWKDVRGVLTGDPRIFSDAQLIPIISYKEAIEMTYFGAQIIHPKTIQPIKQKRIPLHVRSFIDSNLSGTTICETDGIKYEPMIVVTKNQHVLKFSTKDFSFVAEQHLSMLFKEFNNYRIRVNLMRNSAISFIVSISCEEERLKMLIEDLSLQFTIEKLSNNTLITVRHYNDQIIQELKSNRNIIIEERTPETLQMIVDTF